LYLFIVLLFIKPMNFKKGFKILFVLLFICLAAGIFFTVKAKSNFIYKWTALVPDPLQHPQQGKIDDLKLKPGQEIFYKGKWIEIENISVSRRNVPDTRVYNLKIKDTHTFFANDILVHNKVDPSGYLDTANCTEIRGWACDKDTPGTSIDVEIYADGNLLTTVTADDSSEDAVCNACNDSSPCAHRYNVTTPSSLKNCNSYSISAYGIDSGDGSKTQLTNSPRTLGPCDTGPPQCTSCSISPIEVCSPDEPLSLSADLTDDINIDSGKFWCYDGTTWPTVYEDTNTSGTSDTISANSILPVSCQNYLSSNKSTIIPAGGCDCNGCGGGDEHCNPTISLKDPPSAPGWLTFTPYCDSRIKLEWENVDNEDGYRIYKDGSHVQTLFADDTLWYDWSCDGQSHTYEVAAYNDCGSNSISSSATCPITPSVTLSYIIAGCDNGVTVAWEDADNEDWYTLYAPNGSGGYDTYTVSADTTSIFLSDCETGTYTIEAVNGCGTGSDSENLNSCPITPGTPLNFDAQGICDDGGMNFSWDDNSSNEEGFQVFEEGSYSFYFCSAGENGESCSWLTSCDEASYVVRAYNSNNPHECKYSNNSNTDTITCPTTPSAPSNFAAQGLCDNTGIDFSWQDNSSNEDGFKIYNDDNVELASIDTANAESYTHPSCTADSYYIVSYNSECSESSSSNTVSITCPVSPVAPTNFTVTGDCSGSMEFTWNHDTQNTTHFTIFKNGNIFNTFTSDVTSYIDNCEENVYWMQAWNEYTPGQYCKSSNSNPDGPDCSTIPSAPSNLQCEGYCDDRNVLTWTDNSTNEDGFRIYKDGAEVSSSPLGINETSWADNDCDHVAHDYEVTAYNDYCSESSAVSTACTCPECCSVNNVSVSPASGDLCAPKFGLDVSWTCSACNQADSFRIVRRDGGWSATADVLENSVTDDTVGNCSTGKTYDVYCMDALGDVYGGNNSSGTTQDCCLSGQEVWLNNSSSPYTHNASAGNVYDPSSEIELICAAGDLNAADEYFNVYIDSSQVNGDYAQSDGVGNCEWKEYQSNLNIGSFVNNKSSIAYDLSQSSAVSDPECDPYSLKTLTCLSLTETNQCNVLTTSASDETYYNKIVTDYTFENCSQAGNITINRTDDGGLSQTYTCANADGSLTDEPLPCGVCHTYQVCCDNGSETYQCISDQGCTGDCCNITGASCDSANTTKSQIKVDFTHSECAEAGEIMIERERDGNLEHTILLTCTDSSFTDTDLLCGQNYDYTIYCYDNPTAYGSYSVSCSTNSCCTVDTLSASDGVDYDDINLFWTKSNCTAGDEIRISREDDGFTCVNACSDVSCTNTIGCGQTYTYNAYCRDSTGKDSTPVSDQGSTDLCCNIDTTSASDATYADKIVIDYTYSECPQAGEITVQRTDGGWSETFTCAEADGSVENTGLLCEQSYTYETCCDYGTSTAHCKQDTGSTADCCSITDVNAQKGSGDYCDSRFSVGVSWSCLNCSQADSFYIIRSDGNWSSIVGGSERDTIDTTVNCGSNYSYRVYCMDSFGNLYNSSSDSATTDSCCSSGEQIVWLYGNNDSENISAPSGEIYQSGTLAHLCGAGDLGSSDEYFAIEIDNQQINGNYASNNGRNDCIMREYENNQDITSPIYDKADFTYEQDGTSRVGTRYCGSYPLKTMSCIDLTSQPLCDVTSVTAAKGSDNYCDSRFSIDISWSCSNCTQADSFYIQRADGNWSAIVDSSQTSITDSTIDCNESHTYTVYCMDTHGNAYNSSSDSATTDSCCASGEDEIRLSSGESYTFSASAGNAYGSPSYIRHLCASGDLEASDEYFNGYIDSDQINSNYASSNGQQSWKEYDNNRDISSNILDKSTFNWQITASSTVNTLQTMSCFETSTQSRCNVNSVTASKGLDDYCDSRFSIDISWNCDNCAQADSFYIQRADGNWSAIVAQADPNSITDETVDCGSSYTYNVYCMDTLGNAYNSSSDSASTDACCQTGQDEIRLSKNSAYSFSLPAGQAYDTGTLHNLCAYGDLDAGDEYFQVLIDTDQVNSNYAQSNGHSQTPWKEYTSSQSITSFIKDKSNYDFTISAPATVNNLQTMSCIENIPYDKCSINSVTAVKGSDDYCDSRFSIDVSWTCDNCAQADGFYIQRTDGNWQSLVGESQFSITDDTVDCATTYTYNVYCMDSLGNAYNSSSDSATTDSCCALGEEEIWLSANASQTINADSGSVFSADSYLSNLCASGDLEAADEYFNIDIDSEDVDGDYALTGGTQDWKLYDNLRNITLSVLDKTTITYNVTAPAAVNNLQTMSCLDLQEGQRCNITSVTVVPTPDDSCTRRFSLNTSWDCNYCTQAESFYIERSDGSYSQVVLSTEPHSITDNTVDCGTNYSYTVYCMDTLGNAYNSAQGSGSTDSCCAVGEDEVWLTGNDSQTFSAPSLETYTLGTIKALCGYGDLEQNNEYFNVFADTDQINGKYAQTDGHNGLPWKEYDSERTFTSLIEGKDSFTYQTDPTAEVSSLQTLSCLLLESNCFDEAPEQPALVSPGGPDPEQAGYTYVYTTNNHVLTWSSVDFGLNCDGNNNNYLVYFDTDDNPWDSTPTQYSESTNTHSVTDLTWGQTYWWGVRASNDGTAPGSTDNYTDSQVYHFTPVISPWWRASGGDVYSGGDINNEIPSDDYLMLKDAGNEAGVPIAGGTIDIGDAPWTNLVEGDDKDRWAESGSYGGDEYRYSFWENHLQDESKVTETFAGEDPGSTSGIYLTSGSITTTNPWTIPNDKQVVVLVNGDFNITNRISVINNGFLMVVVNGTITIDDGVDNVEGIYVANNTQFSTGGSENDSQLDFQGTLISWDSVAIYRDNGVESINDPVIQFTWRPDLIINAPDYIKKIFYTWEQVPG